ncbi:PglL family O-oligosaccharyltransferase [Enterobacter chuandaensis]|uniref:Wzy polymerase domain-containing protein n=1 Tax=Enterobacter chuandaensis TaxID=2497875 RepID=A0AA96M7N6_9ENTR|nr:PglL family O-oligosaccharyltransferase [Enterobacter chuandaensis]MCW4783058.1 PglL family O-oligosaccharyltransferase [Enterobacter chuandaensis]MDA4760261.1 PglL family O-oligosaccharyltransferase [Enterobacter chuandaensis]WNS37167.1 Wzy polymerase domain-containing protein [Enterobacter chuandaensis]
MLTLFKHPLVSLFVLMACLTLYYIVIMCCYFPNMGGDGVRLPQNILCWLVMTLVSLLAGILVITRRKFNWNMPLVFFCIGCVLFSLPFIWGRAGNEIYALPRFAGLWGGILFYVALLQFPMPPRVKKFLLCILLASALVQTVIAFWQLSLHSADNLQEFLPGSRPYGIFQQVNVLASFVATGYACALWLLFRARNWTRCLLLLAILALFTITLDLLQSRAGSFGCILYVIFLLLTRHRSRLKAVMPAFFCVVIISLVTVHLLKTFGVDFFQLLDTVNKDSSNTHRWLIIKATLEMIKAHPLMGWGYGSYEFQVERLCMSLLNRSFGEHVSHAHNEFLYEWAEGGILAVFGMFAIIAGYFLLVFRSPKGHMPLWGLALPIVFHLMVEYPLIISTPHWMTLLLICRIATQEKKLAESPDLFLGAGMTVIAAAGILFFATGFQTGTVLTRFEREGMRDFSVPSGLINPWIQWERWLYDKHNAMLIRYRRTHDTELLKEYARWGQQFLQYRNDPQVFFNMVRINNVIPDDSRTNWLKKEWVDYYMVAGKVAQLSRQMPD